MANVTVDEGQQAVNNGGFSDVDSGDNVTISASVGSVNQTGTQNGTWTWSFNTTDGPAESDTVVITATDNGSLKGTASFALTVNNVDPVVDTGVVDLTAWTPENISSGSGVWTVAPGGNSVLQSVNGNPTFFYSDFNALGSPLKGGIVVETTGDDDFIGFAIGFDPGDTTNASVDYLLVDWKQTSQNVTAWGGIAPVGLAVSRVTGIANNTNFWSHTGTVTELTRANTLGSTGWADNASNEFQFEFSATRLRVFVNGNLEFDVTPDPSGPQFSDGRFAFYNFSQSQVRYTAIQSDSISGDEASPVSFSKDFEDFGVIDIHTATIDWGDSPTGPGTITVNDTSGSSLGSVDGTHTYADNGTYTVVVEVCDGDGGCDSDTFTATIANVDPTVDPIGPYSVDEGSSVSLSATGADVAGAADPLTYAWDLDDNGSFETPGQIVAFNGVDGPSTHTVKVQVSDGDGGTAVDTAIVTVNNVKPVVTPGAGGAISENDTFNGGGSFTDEGSLDTHTATVDYDDGDGAVNLPISGGAFSLSHQYLDDNPTGTPSDDYTVTICVKDDDTGETCETLTVKVNNDLPVVDAGAGGSISENDTFTGGGSFTDVGSKDTHTATVDYDDGDGPQALTLSGGSISLSHQYLDDNPTGTPSDDYTVTICVKDDDTGVTCESLTVKVNNVAPTASVTCDEIDEGGTANLTATFSDVGTEDTHTMVVAWGDGTEDPSVAVTSPVAISHVYGDDGSFGVTITVTDDDTGEVVSSSTVTVNNVDPDVTLDNTGAETFAGGDAFLGRKGVEQSHDATATDPGSDDLTFDWSFAPDAATASNVYLNDGLLDPDPDPSPTINPRNETDTQSVTFSAPGVYIVEVDATDDDLGSDSDSLTKIVVDDCDCTKSQGFWKHQFSGKGKGNKIDEESLNAYLAIINFVSGVFGEEIALTGIADANSILNPKKGNKGTGGKKDGSKSNEGNSNTRGSRGKGKKDGGSNGGGSGTGTGSNPAKTREKALAQTLAAWLNFAKGAIDLDELVDTDKNGVADTSFRDVIAEVEAILNNEDATKADLERAKKLAEAVNKHDKDNLECDTGTGTKSGTKTGGKGKK